MLVTQADTGHPKLVTSIFPIQNSSFKKPSQVICPFLPCFLISLFPLQNVTFPHISYLYHLDFIAPIVLHNLDGTQSSSM
jgi:hypothetical protein